MMRRAPRGESRADGALPGTRGALHGADGAALRPLRASDAARCAAPLSRRARGAFPDPRGATSAVLPTLTTHFKSFSLFMRFFKHHCRLFFFAHHKMPRGVHLEKFRSLCKIQGIVLRLYCIRFENILTTYNPSHIEQDGGFLTQRSVWSDTRQISLWQNYEL